ncbi:Sporulation kinase E [Sporotomaculum syntrophicum]|uniref:histidine kinase n=1 Tax=Sporotomaculum syntrophicum TaxID=182264 RepID=A0A9D2WN79_9FIRM|nr:PocR ligand-binding domain-containing protein [Sporotomaculum syntrophicum]KAF1083988.1 Sporulation kinase E [Sporotomaculum syntrophicum]
MQYTFSELVDIPTIQKLMEGFYLGSDIISAILDVDGNILVCAGWRDICAKFHRVNSESALLCKKSDLYIKGHSNDEQDNSESYVCYTCANGLIDIAAPIYIEGEHLATVYTGQFLFAEPDIEQFRNRARKYGYNEEEYLDALKKVPIYTKEKAESFMSFFLQLANLLANMGLTRLRLIEAQKIALQESEARLNTIIKHTPNVAIQSYDEQGKILFANKTSESIFGWVNEEVIGKPLEHLKLDKRVSNKFFEFLATTSQTGKSFLEAEWTFINQKGEEKHVFSTFFPIHSVVGKQEFICMDIDITEKKRYEAEMYRLDQLKLTGQMAAGIAHEIRNPMTTVRGLLQLMRDKQEFQAYKSQFDLMINEIDGANAIITEFLALSKTKPAETEMCSLNDLIAKIYPIIQADAYANNMQLSFEPGEVPLLQLNADEIIQLVLNLCRNGLEAMPAGGHLSLKTYQAGQHVVLSVGDEGTGIADENLSMLGKPFFSTKANGTGLGLASCYSIAARHHSVIDYATSPGGTTFFVCFPCEKLL